ncbi:MAG: AAA family ATPase, partial [Ilumatobacteraceae bacterium]|nr:AAA family ATPase [Ilumatobacteraceae bacterium]
MQVLDPMLAAFVPEDRRRAILGGGDLGPTQTGTALFADVSGFSALTTRLAESQGDDRGVEAMATHLADVFTVLVDACRAFGGAVVSFAGDAITCWFDDDDGRRAVNAAAAMHERMANVPRLTISTDDSTRVGLKVSAAQGTVTRAAIGDPEIQLIDVIAGDVVDRMSGGEKIAEPGETLVDQQIVANLGVDLQVATWRTSPAGRYAVVGSITPLAPSPLEVEWPASHRPTGPNWLHPAVHEPLAHDPLAFTAQFRRVVVLFVGFDGPDLDADPRLTSELDRFVRDAQHCVDRLGGAVLGLTLGDKGSHLHAAFGALRRHEDDLSRALTAADELVELAGGLISGVRIGLTAGPCYVGPFGAPDRQTYGLLGLEVNKAARLMAIAPPSTVVVPADIASLQPSFAFEPAGSAELKGFTEPVDICTLAGSAPTRPIDDADESAGVARPAEQREVMGWLADAERGRSLLGVISGPPGIGKSHLATWLRRRASERGVAVLVDGAEALGQVQPYQAVRHLTETVIGTIDAPEDTVAARCAQALAAIGPDAPAKAALLNDILGTDLPETAATEPLDGRARVDNTVELVSRLVHRWRTEQPLLVLLEDAHWFDSATWEVVHELVHLPHTLVVLTSRTPDPVAADARPFDRSRVRQLALSPLGDAETLRLAAMCLGVTELPRTVATLVSDRSEGNPFFVEELARSLRDRGQIDVVDGTCTVSADGPSIDGGTIPDTIEGVVLSRLDQLPPELRLVTRVASAIGRSFATDVLVGVHPGDPSGGLDDRLTALAALDVIEPDPDAPPGTYRFRHAITREVAHDSMTFNQRRSLHHAIGEWYEREHDGHHSSVAATLAYHWRHSDDRRRAVRYLTLAGQQALAANANREALDHLLAAERIARETEAGRWDVAPIEVPPIERARHGQAIGEAYYRLGNLGEASRRLVDAAAAIGRPIPTGTPGRV